MRAAGLNSTVALLISTRHTLRGTDYRQGGGVGLFEQHALDASALMLGVSINSPP